MSLTLIPQYLKTIINIATLNDEDKEHYTKLLDKISNFSVKHRNVVAHSVFLPDENGKGVKFLVVRAKGKLQFPEIIWSEKTFRERDIKMSDFCEEIETLQKKLKGQRIIKSLAEALIQTKQGTDTQESSNLPLPLPPDSQN